MSGGGERSGGAAAALTDEQIKREIASVGGWRREGDRLVRLLQLRDFDEALAFLELLAARANDYGRRPDVCISEFNRVRLEISNLHHAGLTLAEFRLAAKVDAVIDEHRPAEGKGR